MNTKGGLTKRNSQVQEMQQKDTSLKGLIKAMEPEYPSWPGIPDPVWERLPIPAWLNLLVK